MQHHRYGWPAGRSPVRIQISVLDLYLNFILIVLSLRELVLVKSTLSAIPVHVSIAVGLSGWAIGAIDRLRRSFLWSGSDLLFRGKAKVAWLLVCRPRPFGGLGVPNLVYLGLALRIRWCWLQKVDPERIWVELPQCFDHSVRDLFRACVDIVLENGESIPTDNWLEGLAIEVIAPNLFAAVPPRCRGRTVADGLLNRSWIGDIKGPLSVEAVAEYVDIWEWVENHTLSNLPDRFLWHFTSDFQYSSASAYRACFFGSTLMPGARILWKTKAPPKRFRIDAGRRNDAGDMVCRTTIMVQGPRRTELVAIGARWSVELRRLVAACKVGAFKIRKHGLDSLILLVAWTIWKERNERVFRRRASMPWVVTAKIKEEA
ncbi:LOW QUALITY PROTEIN: hypothetical protein U9M48_027119 [Paspalum notatum var. saurae]|uniref:Reverse transcriptase zinc-binding domain-containing protein n=1 Tax=Paspalum notatum var. saurae TaxID=547442 RepID=A0AAQ3TVW3_PASNO